MSTPGIAANAYAQLSRIADQTAGIAKTIGDDAKGNGPNFGALLKEAIDGVSELVIGMFRAGAEKL